MVSSPTFLQRIKEKLPTRSGHEEQESKEGSRKPRVIELQQIDVPGFEIAPNDPLVPYFLSASEAVEIDRLQVDSPALKALKAAHVKLAIPLVSQGELVGLLALGPRLSEQDYSSDDRGLLNTLATQAAPAVRVAQMIREQQAAIRERERVDQELRVARLIQRTLLPQELPTFAGWQLAAYYQPAREVGGDFYDFLSFDDERLGIIIGDVTDKGVPAALVMATTRSILRSVAQNEDSPGLVLEKVNDLLHHDIPPKMFVTCLYAILDTHTGRLWYANAGHDLPYHRHGSDVSELRATGMPLGLMPGMQYEEKELLVEPGDSVLFYSDGIVESHNPQREMFGFPKLMALLCDQDPGDSTIDYLLGELAAFTGAAWEQEDDVTLVTLQRTHGYGISGITTRSTDQFEKLEGEDVSTTWHTLGEWMVPSQPGNERLVMEQVVQLVKGLSLPSPRLEKLKTAVAEATMNAMEHGNHYQPDKPVSVSVSASNTVLKVAITDHGGTRLLVNEAAQPDIEAKLAELQSPRGWGLFLIKNMVDDMHIISDETHHTVELILYLEGEHHDGETA